ncbi:MAG: hypothetical protein AAFQ07_06835 [Chloroflexota bacterium]
MRISRLFLNCLLSVLICLSFAFVASAQDLDETYEWDNGVEINYPDDWEAYEDDNDLVHFTDDELDMFIFFEDYDADDDLEDYIEDAFEIYRFDSSARFDDDDVIEGEYGDIDLAAVYFYEEDLDGDEFERGIIAIPLSDELIAIAIVVPLFDDELDDIDIIIDMLGTLSLEGDGGSSSSGDTFEFDNGTQIELFDEWEADNDIISNDLIEIEFLFFDVDDERTDTRAARLRETYADLAESNDDYDEALLQFLTLDVDDEALQYIYDETDDGDTYSAILIALSIDNNTVIVAVVRPSDTDEGSIVVDDIGDVWALLDTLDD